jgi:hypothetical protein
LGEDGKICKNNWKRMKSVVEGKKKGKRCKKS